MKFEKSKGMNASTRASRAKENVGVKKNDNDKGVLTDDSGNESEGVKAPKKVRSSGIPYLLVLPVVSSLTILTQSKPSAARSIMAFLGDQSESGED